MTAIFEVRAIVDPQSLCRILGHFSQAWVTPRNVEAHMEDDFLICRCVIDAIDQVTAIRIAHKLEASPLILSAQVQFAPCEG